MKAVNVADLSLSNKRDSGTKSGLLTYQIRPPTQATIINITIKTAMIAVFVPLILNTNRNPHKIVTANTAIIGVRDCDKRSKAAVIINSTMVSAIWALLLRCSV